MPRRKAGEPDAMGRVRKDGALFYPRIIQQEERWYPSVTTFLGIIDKPGLVRWAANLEGTAVAAADLTLLEEILTRPGLTVTRQNILPLFAEGQRDDQRVKRQKEHIRETEKAAEIGTVLHHAIENYLKGAKEAKIDLEPAWLAYEHFKEWADGVHLEVLAIEKRVASDLYGFAGTIDLYAKINGRKTVVDWKTSNRRKPWPPTQAIPWGEGLYLEPHLQNCAYRQALAETGEISEAGLMVRLPKTAERGNRVEPCPAKELDFVTDVLPILQTWRSVRRNDGLFAGWIPPELRPFSEQVQGIVEWAERQPLMGEMDEDTAQEVIVENRAIAAMVESA